MDRRATRLNRVGLTLFGLALLALGGLGLALGLNVFGRGRAGELLLAEQTRRFAAEHSWYWPVVAAVAVVLALLGLMWLFRQAKSDRLPGLALEPDASGGKTRLSAKAVTEALEVEIGEYPGVKGARARLTGSADQPKLRLNVAYNHRADLAALRNRITTQAIARLSGALERDSVPAVVRLRLVSGGEEGRSVA